MSGPIGKLIGPAKTRLQRYVEEESSLPSSTIEEKLRVEEVIARINTNVSLLERCNRFIKEFEDRRKGQRGGVPTSSRGK